MKKSNFLDYPLWHRIETPFVESWCLIFSGKEGRKAFNKKAAELDKTWVDVNETDGMSVANYIYVEDIENNIDILLHELSHYYDYVVSELGCENECEFKARLSQFIYYDIFKKSLTI